MQTNKGNEIIKFLGYEVNISRIDNPQLRKAIIGRFNHKIYAHTEYHSDDYTDEYVGNPFGKDEHTDYQESVHTEYSDAD